MQLWKQKKKKTQLFRDQNTRESRRRREEFDVKSDEKVTEVLITEVQKKCWSKEMGAMKQSHHLQLRKFL